MRTKAGPRSRNPQWDFGFGQLGSADNALQSVADQPKSGDQQNAANRFHDNLMLGIAVAQIGNRGTKYCADGAKCTDHSPTPGFQHRKSRKALVSYLCRGSQQNLPAKGADAETMTRPRSGCFEDPPSRGGPRSAAVPHRTGRPSWPNPMTWLSIAGIGGDHRNIPPSEGIPALVAANSGAESSKPLS